MKKFYFLIAFALLGLNQAWANKAKIEQEEFNGNRAWSGPHASFVISGEGQSTTTFGGDGRKLAIEKNKEQTISWTVDEGCVINVTNLDLKVGSSTPGNGDFYLYGTRIDKIAGWNTNEIHVSDLSLGNDGNIVLSGSKNFNIYYLDVTYTITPVGKPSAIVTETQFIDVTLDEANKQTVNLKSLFALPEGVPADFELGYEVSGGTVEGNTFYATEAGDYTVKARIAAIADDHEASELSDGEVTITVNRLDQTLSWVDELNINTNMVIGSEQTIVAVSTSGRAVTYVSDNEAVLTVDADGKLTAMAEGEATITASRDQDGQYNAAESIQKSFSVHSKLTPFFVPQGFVTTDSCAIRKNEAATIKLTNVSEGLDGAFTAVPGDEKISVSRDGDILTIQALEVGTTTLTLTQTETEEINPAEVTYTIEVLRLVTTIRVNEAEEYALILNPSQSLDIAFSSNNDETDAFVVEQLTGEQIAVLNEGVLATNYREGEATWRVSLPQTANFEAAEITLSVTVARLEEAKDCYLVDDAELVEWNTISNSKTYEFAESVPGAVLTFEARRVALMGFSSNSNFYAQTSVDGSNWSDLITLDIPKTDTWYPFEQELPEDARYVRFATKGGATGYRSIQNVKVTRKTWLKAENVELKAQFGEEECAGTLTVDYSLANGGDLKIVCDNEKFVLESYVIENEDCSGGVANIKVTYPTSRVIEDAANLIIYNGVYRHELQLTAVIEATAEPETTYGEYEAVFCQGDSVEFNGVWYYAPTETPLEILLDEKNITGGDSIVNLTILELQPDFVELFDTLNVGDVLVIETDGWFRIIDEEQYPMMPGEWPLSEEGLYDLTATFTNEHGCDSVVLRHIVVIAVETTGVENIQTDKVQSTKILRDGVLYLRRGDSLFTIEGRRVR